MRLKVKKDKIYITKVCPWKRLIAFVSVNKNPRLYGRGCIVNIDMDYLRSLAFIRTTLPSRTITNSPSSFLFSQSGVYGQAKSLH